MKGPPAAGSDGASPPRASPKAESPGDVSAGGDPPTPLIRVSRPLVPGAAVLAFGLALCLLGWVHRSAGLSGLAGTGRRDEAAGVFGPAGLTGPEGRATLSLGGSSPFSLDPADTPNPDSATASVDLATPRQGHAAPSAPTPPAGRVLAAVTAAPVRQTRSGGGADLAASDSLPQSGPLQDDAGTEWLYGRLEDVVKVLVALGMREDPLPELLVADLAWDAEIEGSLPAWMNLRHAAERLTYHLPDVRVTVLPAHGQRGNPGSGTASPDHPGGGGLALELTPPGSDSTLRAVLWREAPAGRLALIVDDVGYWKSSTRRLLTCELPLTLAIIPFTPRARYAAREGPRVGLETILHLPMEPTGTTFQRGFLLRSGDTPETLREKTARALDAVPGVSGVNNHLGSWATRNGRLMAQVASVLRKRGLFFIDSLTTEESVAARVARSMGVPTARRTAPFLDNSHEQADIAARFREAFEECARRGEGIAILHDRPESVEVLLELVPAIRAQGIELCYASELVE